MPQGNLFAVVNDSSLLIPISLPNTPKLEKNYLNNFNNVFYQPNKTNYTIAICQGQNYGGHNTTGIFTDTLVGYNGCDSIRTVNLTVKPVFNTTVTTSICPGQNYAGHTTSGTFTDIYTAINGCDSTRILNLTVYPVIATTVNAAICPGQNYAGHTTAGTFIDVYPAITGCDSTRTLHLTIKPVFATNITAVICQDENYAVNPKKFTTVDTAICKGFSYFAGGKLQITAGTYFDTLDTWLGCDSVITTNLVINPLPAPDLGNDRGICIGDMLTLNPGNFVTYLWQDGSSNPIFTTNIVGRYSVLVTNVFGCKASDTMRLQKIFPLPKDYLPADTSLCRGNIVTVKIPGYTNYLWSNGSGFNFMDIIKTGTYVLDVVDRNGCKGTDSIKVLYYNCADVWIPNAFSPNEDGSNDIFKPVFPAPVTNYHLQVWSRWGLRVFESTTMSKGWDGKFKGEGQQLGVYIYQVSFTSIDGVDMLRKGTVMLIR
jgi:gliding motility-associated-like protein